MSACETLLPGIEETLTRALALAKACDKLYRKGTEHERRELNRFFFEKLLVREADTSPQVLYQRAHGDAR